MTLTPFEQGGLDSLCGIYSLVNAEKTINQTTESESQDIFNEIIYFIEEQNLLGKILTEGMLLKHLKSIIASKLKHRISYEIPFSGVATPSLDVFWTKVSEFLSGNEPRAVLIGMSGIYDHWSVIDKIHENRIDLHDSNNIKRLNRSSCTTGYQQGKRKHVLWPAQTLFISKLGVIL